MVMMIGPVFEAKEFQPLAHIMCFIEYELRGCRQAPDEQDGRQRKDDDAYPPVCRRHCAWTFAFHRLTRWTISRALLNGVSRARGFRQSQDCEKTLSVSLFHERKKVCLDARALREAIEPVTWQDMSSLQLRERSYCHFPTETFAMRLWQSLQSSCVSRACLPVRLLHRQTHNCAPPFWMPKDRSRQTPPSRVRRTCSSSASALEPSGRMIICAPFRQRASSLRHRVAIPSHRRQRLALLIYMTRLAS